MMGRLALKGRVYCLDTNPLTWENWTQTRRLWQLNAATYIDNRSSHYCPPFYNQLQSPDPLVALAWVITSRRQVRFHSYAPRPMLGDMLQGASGLTHRVVGTENENNDFPRIISVSLHGLLAGNQKS